MLKTIAFVSIITTRLIYQPGETKQHIAPFTSQPPLSAATILHPARVTSITASVKDNKVMLKWTVGENETADLFEVEKSSDGKNFKTAALVFGSDLPETASYEFFEKAGNSKQQYRVKLVNKNKTAEYSPVVEIAPAA